MLKKAALVAAASLFVMAPAALADSNDNDGINILNDNNISILPIQLCGNDLAVLGAIVNLASPDISQCTNAPILDHVNGG